MFSYLGMLFSSSLYARSLDPSALFRQPYSDFPSSTDLADATAVHSLPEKYRKRLRTTNAQERYNEEIRCRERVIRVLPNTTSAQRLAGALLIELDEAGTTGHRYLDRATTVHGGNNRLNTASR